MLKLRQMIVTYLSLSYRVRLFGKEFTYPRAANVLAPLMLLLGYALLNNTNYPELDAFTWVALSINAVMWTIVIGYLRFYPVQWEELDDEQKWFFGNGALSGRTKAVMTTEQHKEWEKIAEKETKDKRTFHNVLPFLVNPVILLIFLFIIYA